MNVQIIKQEILCSGKFQSRYREADQIINYSIGFSRDYKNDVAGVHMQLRDRDEDKERSMYIRMTPEVAEKMAAQLIEWAVKAREYQSKELPCKP